MATPLRIPTEIVHHFFAFFATTLSTAELGRFPWFLGHICSTWRSIFLSMDAEFWRRISIIYSWKESEYAEDVLRFFLERDPAAPFSFELYVDPLATSNSQRQTLYMLTDASARWSGATFEMSPRYMLPLKHTKNRLPLLQELRIVIVDEIPDSLSDVFQNAPSLNVVNVFCLANWKFDLSNLKAIDVDKLGSGASDFIAALPQMAKLEWLRIGIKEDYYAMPTIDYYDMPTDIVLLPSLTTLDCESDWLPSLEAPALKNFTVIYSGPKSFETMLSFLHRSRCNTNISSLSIRLAPEATAVEIIRQMPNITHLELECVKNIGEVFKQLTVSTNLTRELPARHMVSLSIPDMFLKDTKQLYDLISSRTVGSAVDNCGHKRLRKLVTGAYLTQNLIVLCEEREVQWIMMGLNGPYTVDGRAGHSGQSLDME